MFKSELLVPLQRGQCSQTLHVYFIFSKKKKSSETIDTIDSLAAPPQLLTEERIMQQAGWMVWRIERTEATAVGVS